MVANFIAAVIGATAHWIIIFLNRTKSRNNNPTNFNIRFLITDNVARLVFTMICVWVWAVAGETFIKIWPSFQAFSEYGILGYIGIGFLNHHIVNVVYKKYKQAKKFKLESND